MSYFLYVHPFHTFLVFHCKGKEAYRQVQCALWNKNCTQITSEQPSTMIGNVTQDLWVLASSYVPCTRHRQLCQITLVFSSSAPEPTKFLNVHHNAMKHSVRTGRVECDREDREVPCHDDEMEHQKLMCSWIHFCQWQLAVPGVNTDEPVDNLVHSPAKIQPWLDNCLATMETLLIQRLETLFWTGGTQHAHSYTMAHSVHSATQDLAATQLWLDNCLVTMEQSIIQKLEPLFCMGHSSHAHSYPKTHSVHGST